MKKVFNQLHVRLVFLAYLYALIVFSIFRIMLFVLEFDKLSNGINTPEFLTIIKAFIMGLRFDLVITGYLMLLPFLILSVLELLNRPIFILKKITFYIIIVTFSVSFLICASDIPFFGQFYSRFSVAAFQWADSPGFVLRMIFKEPRYWVTLIPLIALIWAFYKSLRRPFLSEHNIEHPKVHLGIKFVSFLIIAVLILAGIRGRIEAKSPIRVGTAYFCDNSFLNQLGLNPNFTLIRSYISSKQPKAKSVELMDNKKALLNVQKYLNVNPVYVENPIVRKRNSNTLSKHKYNVVLVIMESMSAGKMGRYGNEDNLTPSLDSLAMNAYSFDNFYSAGMHTYNGIYGTLFSYPAIYLQHPMIDVRMLKYNGISNVLKKHKYTSVYFTTHDGQFDNVEGFLTNNEFDRIITEANYPKNIAKTGLGVPDDYMFDFAIPILDDLATKSAPFIATFMTASDHGPYYIPEYFTPKQSEEKKQIVEYADWSIGKFISKASTYGWFDSTIFVFIADHGSPMNPTYEMPLDYYHSPFIIYAPKIIKPQSFNCIGGQIDVFPTLMGIFNLEYMNNTFGIDLINEKRPFIYFNGDDKVGVLNHDYFLISKLDGSEALYKYNSRDRKNYIEEYSQLADSMRTYALSNLQAAQYIMQNNMQYYSGE
jgi:phosphoglycerol transferase MdoB-like AlkP superfamily enzyme